MAKVPAGGSSTINGVLYQMLWALFRTASLRLVTPPRVDGKEGIVQATLILETRGGGGDQQEVRHDRRYVDQLKALADGGSWSLRDVVEEVLPELYKAVDLGRTDTDYRFVTEGRLGDWPRVYDFFRGLRARPCPAGDVLSAGPD